MEEIKWRYVWPRWLGSVRSCWEAGMCQPLVTPHYDASAEVLVFQNTSQVDGHPETVGRRSAMASFRHCCLIKWLSGNTALGLRRRWIRIVPSVTNSHCEFGKQPPWKEPPWLNLSSAPASAGRLTSGAAPGSASVGAGFS